MLRDLSHDNHMRFAMSQSHAISDVIWMLITFDIVEETRNKETSAEGLVVLVALYSSLPHPARKEASV